MGHMLYKNGKNSKYPGLDFENITERTAIKSYTRFSLYVFRYFHLLARYLQKHMMGSLLLKTFFAFFSPMVNILCYNVYIIPKLSQGASDTPGLGTKSIADTKKFAINCALI